MRVLKRNGSTESVSFNKVLQRIRKASKGLAVNPDAIAQQVLARIVNGIRTSDLDELTAQMSASLCTTHPDWGTLASRIAVSNHHKNTEANFTKVVEILSNQVHKSGDSLSYISSDVTTFVSKHAQALDAYIKHERDYDFDYFGFKTLEKSYLLKNTEGKVIERPQHMWMRVAVGIWHKKQEKSLEQIFETYDLLSQKFMTHATPTLFNAGTPRPQLSSCYLLAMSSDSIAGIYKTLGDCAAISKYAGGIGLHLHNIRARGSLIKGTNGTSNGLVPMLRVFNNTARYVDQCFTPDTLVQTSPTSSQNIKSIQEGDSVLTTGGYRKVNKAVTHWLDSVTMKAITSDSGITVRVTQSHPILALKNTTYTLQQVKDGIKNSLFVPEYLDVSELKVGDFLVGPNSLNTITAITDVVYTGPVHDFEIEAPHDYYISDFGFAHNGGGRRNGSFAMYLEPWHADVEDFLRMKLNSGTEEERARDLFYALWIPDLFMERVETDAEWSLFCPDEAPGLADVYGPAFKELYTGYEAKGLARKTVSARKLWFQILDSQMETGTPYLLYKDAANMKSNQKNIGTVKSSNLCCEIMEVSTPEETAVCNLASLALPAFVTNGTFDFAAMRKVVKVAVRNLNQIIDINFYPTPETERSNLKHRPIGIGVQGLADVFAILGLAWETEEASDMNQRIFEHLYYAAVEESADLAQLEGSYETFEGSPASQGKLQPDLWTVTPLTETDGTLDWTGLRQKAQQGLRNSLLVAPMPTASTSQILGYNECFEPFTSNIYTRRTLAGEFIVINRHLMKELMDLGLWSDDMKQRIVAQNGSIQSMEDIPLAVRERYKTTWEIPQKTLIDMAAARGAFICQSQSLNLFVADPNYAKLTSMHFYGWKKGLKTGCYYLRTKAPVAAQKFTVDPRLLAAVQGSTVQDMDDAKESDVENDDTDDDVPSNTKVSSVKVQTVSTIQETRSEKLERLVKEFEEEVARSKAATETGEGCLLCSS